MPQIEIKSNKLYYRVKEEGTQDIVFIHGFCQSSLFWESTLEVLPVNYRGIAVDLRGFGDSGNAEGPYSIPLFAEDLKHLIDKLCRRKIVLVGNSMGGVVCQFYTLRYPDTVSKLV